MSDSDNGMNGEKEMPATKPVITSAVEARPEKTERKNKTCSSVARGPDRDNSSQILGLRFPLAQ